MQNIQKSKKWSHTNKHREGEAWIDKIQEKEEDEEENDDDEED